MNQGTLLDVHGPQMDPEMDPATQILGEPDQIKSLKGPLSIFNII